MPSIRWFRPCLTLLAVATGCGRTVPPADPGAAEARRFVQEFYDRYRAEWDRPTGGAPWELALRPGAPFDSGLVAALRADSAMRARATDEVVGLDGDPFLDAQDPCARYETGAVERGDGAWRVAVHQVCDGRRDPLPRVVALVAPEGRWHFVDFEYPSRHESLRAWIEAQQHPGTPEGSR